MLPSTDWRNGSASDTKVTRSNRVSVTQLRRGSRKRYTHRRPSARSRRRSSAPSWHRTTASSEAVSHGNPTTRICTYPLVTTKSLVPTSLPLARKTRRKLPTLYIDNPIGSSFLRSTAGPRIQLGPLSLHMHLLTLARRASMASEASRRVAAPLKLLQL